VQDTGPGLAPGLLRSLRNEPVEGNHKEETLKQKLLKAPESEGIGLTIVKRLSQLLEARLDVENTATSGTIFRIHLPRRYDKR
jgi:two-component system, chemotaxis family, CheB/CheR fusion protein